MKVCNVPGCPTLTDTGRCDTCRREADKARGTTTQRGLGWDHQQLTAQQIRRQPWCSYCGETQAQVQARGDKLTGEHVVERSQGGRTEAGNYTTSCGRCNYGRVGGRKSRAPDAT